MFKLGWDFIVIKRLEVASQVQSPKLKIIYRVSFILPSHWKVKCWPVDVKQLCVQDSQKIANITLWYRLILWSRFYDFDLIYFNSVNAKLPRYFKLGWILLDTSKTYERFLGFFLNYWQHWTDCDNINTEFVFSHFMLWNLKPVD